MTKQQIDGMLKDVGILESYLDEESVSIANDVCHHVKALAGFVEDLQLLLMRKNAALDVFSSPLQWVARNDCFIWNGADEYKNPAAFAARERDADYPDDR